MVPIWGNFGRWLRETLNPLNPMCQHDNQHCGNTWIKLASSVGTKGEGLWRFLEERWKMTPRGLRGLGSSWLVYGAIVSSPLWHDSHWQLNHLPDFKLPNFSAGSQKRKTHTESFRHPPSAIHYPQIIEKKKKKLGKESIPNPTLSCLSRAQLAQRHSHFLGDPPQALFLSASSPLLPEKGYRGERHWNQKKHDPISESGPQSADFGQSLYFPWPKFCPSLFTFPCMD